MSLTLANSITQVRAALNEATATYWSDDEITFWIQEGCRVFSSKTLMMEDTQDIDPLVANQLRYTSGDQAWIANILEPYTAIYYNGSSKYKGLIKIEPKQIGNLATFTSGEPKYYCMHDRSIYLFPLVSAAVVMANGVVTLLFSSVTSDITDITDEYQHLPIIYAVAKAKQKDQHFGESASLMSQFFQETNFERADKHTREKDNLEAFKVRKGR